MAWSTPRTWVTGELVTAALLNTHIRDNQNAGFPTAAAWTSWSPTLSNLTLGNGTAIARYTQIGETVTARYKLTFGSTSAVSGSVQVSPPVAYTAAHGATDWMGIAVFNESGGSRYFGRVSGSGSDDFLLRVFGSGGTYLQETSLSSTIPFTWGTDDELMFQATYEIA